MEKKYFKDNQSYFKYFNKYKENINVIRVKPMSKNNKSQICLFYERKVLAL